MEEIWINVAYKFDQQYAEEVSRGDRSRWWTYQLLNTSFIVMLIKSKT